MKTDIAIRLTDKEAEIGCTQDGKRLDMEQPDNMRSVATILHNLSIEMLGHVERTLFRNANNSN